jgi:predicted type IV restriction endonuclease
MRENNYIFLKKPLNLPTSEFQIKEEGGKLSIFDALRKKFLILTPEEWVRQHVIYYLITYKQYPKSLISLEKGLKYNQIQKRFDILVLDRKGNPFLLVECKAPEIKISQKTAEQIAVYNQTIGAKYLAVSNGNQHLCLSYEGNSKSYEQLREFPEFQS